MRSGPSTISGATQTPLLHADQLVPGVFLTGVAFNNVWEVLGIQGDDVALSLLQATPNIHCAAHTLRPPITGTLRTCACGYVLEAVASLLPLRDDTPRVVLLVPHGPLVVPDAYTVYLTGTGETLTANAAHQWGVESMPVIPKVYPLWTVPEHLRDMIRAEVEHRDQQGPAAPHPR